MFISEITNGWYGEALPEGEFAVTRILADGPDVLSHLGSIPTEGDVALFTRCTAVGGFKIACQWHNRGYDAIYVPGASWSLVGPSYGINPVIFDPSGNLHRGAPEFGSQGFRYYDDSKLYTGDQTYVHPTIPSLYEYTTHGDVTVGQGGNGGAIIVYAGQRYVLESGDTRFIRFNREGNKLAFAIVKPGYVVLKWLTVEEIKQLPLESQPAPVPAPKPAPPVIVEVPKVSLEAPNKLNVVEATYARTAVNTRDEVTRGAFVDEVIAALGGFPWGRKGRDKAGTDLNTDGLTYRRQDGLFEVYDIIIGSSGKPTWDGYGPFKDGENGYFIERSTPPQAPPTNPPADPLPDIDLSPFLAALEDLRARVEQLETRLNTLPAQAEYELKVTTGKILGAPYVKAVELEKK